eukprot:916174-Amphidinium_carterae.1
MRSIGQIRAGRIHQLGYATQAKKGLQNGNDLTTLHTMIALQRRHESANERLQLEPQKETVKPSNRGSKGHRCRLSSMLLSQSTRLLTSCMAEA